MLLEELFFEIGIVLVVAAALSLFVHRLRQPLIVAYILTGIVVGPSVFQFARSPEIFDVMSQIGVAFLLFTVGLGLNWRSVKDVGGISLATGVGQVLFTSIAGYSLGIILGFTPITSIYLAVSFAFSSTIIIIKLLADKEDLDTLYGRISVGFLLVQDFIAMFILLALSGLSSGQDLSVVFTASLVKIVFLIPVFWLLSAHLVPRILGYAAKSQELLFVFAIAWCFLIAGVLVWAGFGVELGALIAGVTLSGTVYHQEITTRIRPLRDFFLIIFFIVLGTHLDLSTIGQSTFQAIIFSLFVLVGNPMIVLMIMRALGYHPRTGFLAGTTVAQISEFSFIVVTAGIAIGHLDESALAIATLVGLITITASSYLIENNERVFEFIKPSIKWLEPRRTLSSELLREHKPTHIVMFGYHRMGSVLLKTVKRMKRRYTLVDFDPQVIRELSEAGEPSVYGDAGDETFLEEIKLDKSKFIVSTIPDFIISSNILTFLKSKEFKGVVVVSARTKEEAMECYRLGATYVIVPSVLGGEKFSDILSKKKTAKTGWSTLGKKHELHPENGII